MVKNDREMVLTDNPDWSWPSIAEQLRSIKS